MQQVYFLSAHALRFIKIGISNNAERRVRDLQLCCPYPLKLLYTVDFNRPKDAERLLHQRCAASWVHTEWFKADRPFHYEMSFFVTDPEEWFEQAVDQSVSGENHYQTLRRLRTESRLIQRAAA